jgi:alginate O-acetyltransferase complex protein AlgI
VLTGWVFFRIEDFNEAIFYIGKMFSFDFANPVNNFDTQFYFTISIGFVFAFITLFKSGRHLEKLAFYKELNLSGHAIFILLSILFLMICTAFITASGFNPFIYFRF